MLKKIILPVVILIFTQQEFYGMYEVDNEEKQNMGFWEKIDYYCNGLNEDVSPRLWLVWSILDNVPFQYGGSRIWKHGEAYYGLSNGIGFFPSILNFGLIKIGIIDAHINVINTVLVGFKYFVKRISRDPDNYSLWENILYTLYYNSVITGIHLLSFNFLNCIKIKIISIGIIIGEFIGIAECDSDEGIENWYHKCYGDSNKSSIGTYGDMNCTYLLLSPRMEINISGIINYFNAK